MNTRRHLLLSALSSLALITTAGAHGFHASFSVLEFNARTQSLEIIHRIFIQDLELALSDQAGAPVTIKETPEDEARVREYLARVFQISADGKTLNPEWVGFELKVDTMFVYQELKDAMHLKTLRVKDSILTESHPGQVNTVNITKNGRTQTLIFTKADDAQSIAL